MRPNKIYKNVSGNGLINWKKKLFNWDCKACIILFGKFPSIFFFNSCEFFTGNISRYLFGNFFFDTTLEIFFFSENKARSCLGGFALLGEDLGLNL